MPDRIRPGRFSPATVVASRVSPSSNSRRIRSAGVVGSQTQPFIERQSASIWPCRVRPARDPALARSEVAVASRTGASTIAASSRRVDGPISSDKAVAGAAIPSRASSGSMTGIAVGAGYAAAAARSATASAACSGAAAPFRATPAAVDPCRFLSGKVLAIQPSDSWRYALFDGSRGVPPPQAVTGRWSGSTPDGLPDTGVMRKTAPASFPSAIAPMRYGSPAATYPRPFIKGNPFYVLSAARMVRHKALRQKMRLGAGARQRKCTANAAPPPPPTWREDQGGGRSRDLRKP